MCKLDPQVKRFDDDDDNDDDDDDDSGGSNKAQGFL